MHRTFQTTHFILLSMIRLHSDLRLEVATQKMAAFFGKRKPPRVNLKWESVLRRAVGGNGSGVHNIWPGSCLEQQCGEGSKASLEASPYSGHEHALFFFFSPHSGGVRRVFTYRHRSMIIGVILSRTPNKIKRTKTGKESMATINGQIKKNLITKHAW